MTTLARILALAFVVVVAASAADPAYAGRVQAYVPGPLAIGDQVFAGGRVELVDLSSSGLVAIRLDGRQIALAFREMCGADLSSAAPRMLVARDARGLQHLVGLRSAVTATAVQLRIATVARGLSTAPPLTWARTEQLARAAR